MIDTWTVSGLRAPAATTCAVARPVVPRDARGLADHATAGRPRRAVRRSPVRPARRSTIAGIALGIARGRDRGPASSSPARRRPTGERATLAERARDADAQVARPRPRCARRARSCTTAIATAWEARRARRRGARSSSGRRCASRPATRRRRRPRPSTRPTTSAAAPRSTRPARSRSASATSTRPRSTC